LALLAAGGLRATRAADAQPAGGFTPVARSGEDKLIVPPGYSQSVVVRWGDPRGR
jgi:hypothetical protein